MNDLFHELVIHRPLNTQNNIVRNRCGACLKFEARVCIRDNMKYISNFKHWPSLIGKIYQKLESKYQKIF